jgi:hypothetical protein
LVGPIKLANDAATMDDCTSIWELANPGTPAPTPMPLMIGYLVLLSPRDLDVVSVTTAGASAAGQTPGAVAIDTLVVQGKRVTIPPNAFPQGAFPAPEEFADSHNLLAIRQTHDSVGWFGKLLPPNHPTGHNQSAQSRNDSDIE